MEIQNQSRHTSLSMSWSSTVGSSFQCATLVPSNLQDPGKSGTNKTTVSLNICLCSWLRIFHNYLGFFVITRESFAMYVWKTANSSQVYKKTVNKSSSGFLMIHHDITYLEMSLHAHYLTRQTTTVKEIPFTAEIPAILNLARQRTSCPGATVLRGSRIWVCKSTCTILAHSHRKKKYILPNHFTEI